MIKKQIQKVNALHDAQISHTTYRGVDFQVGNHEPKETHGTFQYRGHIYNKWLSNKLNSVRMGVVLLPFFMEKDKLKLIVRNLKLLVDALESEVYSDVEAYTTQYQAPITDYEEIFDDDDGYPD